MINQNQTENIKAILCSLIDNPADVELAAFLLQKGYSIRDYFLYKDILGLMNGIELLTESSLSLINHKEQLSWLDE